MHLYPDDSRSVNKISTQDAYALIKSRYTIEDDWNILTTGIKLLRTTTLSRLVNQTVILAKKFTKH